MQVSLWGLRPPNHGETRVGRDSRQGHSGERAGAAHRVQEARVVPRGDPQPRAEERIAAWDHRPTRAHPQPLRIVGEAERRSDELTCMCGLRITIPLSSLITTSVWITGKRRTENRCEGRPAATAGIGAKNHGGRDREAAALGVVCRRSSGNETECIDGDGRSYRIGK